MQDPFDLSGRVAVVTGGSRGIGRAIAEEMADAGAAVVPAARSTADLEAVVDAIEARGGEAHPVAADVTARETVEDLVAETVAEFGGLDVLVNNAGVNPGAALGRPEDVDPEAFVDTVEVNLQGAFACAQAASDHLQKSDAGSVINVASIGGVVGLPRQHPYVASKHGLVGLTRSMALDWAPAVRVNAIAPGYVATAFIEDAIDDDDIRASLLDRTPLDRFAEPEEIAGPAVFLASDAASFVTGSVLTVDGGWTSR